MNFSATICTQKLIKSEEMSKERGKCPTMKPGWVRRLPYFEQRGPMVFGCQRTSDAMSQRHPHDWRKRVETAISYSCFSPSASGISRLQPASP